MLAKSQRYACSDGTRLCLLMYTTDWHFELSDVVIGLLQFWTGEHSQVFSEIYAFVPIAADDGRPYLIHPVPRDYYEGFEPDRFRGNRTYIMDPERGVLTIDPENGALSFGWDVPLEP